MRHGCRAGPHSQAVRRPAAVGPAFATVIDSGGRLIAEHLLSITDGKVHVFDACCGVGTLASRILQSLGSDAARISYLAVDRDSACIDSIRAAQSMFAGFSQFRTLHREVSDLRDIPGKSADLLVLCHALHEIPPREYPGLFSEFNRLLRPDRGRMLLIDLEELPEGESESIAITWRGSEVREFLSAAGLIPALSLHQKATDVFQIKLAATSPESFSQDRMHSKIQALLSEALPRLIEARSRINAQRVLNRTDYKRWLVLTGTIARIAEELIALASFPCYASGESTRGSIRTASRKST